MTSFEYRLHNVGPTLFGGKLIYTFEQARDVLKFFALVTFSKPLGAVTATCGLGHMGYQRLKRMLPISLGIAPSL